ncbi:MAG: cytochrome C oxidase subunit IV family protein [Woeseiaceae bacterium]|jgi:cytochrome c oxidase subunit 4|nr:cytochrome C oxidase subunit IV family protein [Woeseiaceae bacterium]|tara:strand:- start:1250 stop:1597 length:348 start_codon:yes stop_codon:yes gene_type:complete
MSSDEGQQHPLTIYWIMWTALFVLSGFSYATDFMDPGYVRWGLILTLMFAKAGGIVFIFMHMGWERLALKLAILVPPVFIGVLIILMALEADYTFLTRIEFFGESPMEVETPGHH